MKPVAIGILLVGIALLCVGLYTILRPTSQTITQTGQMSSSIPSSPPFTNGSVTSASTSAPSVGHSESNTDCIPKKSGNEIVIPGCFSGMYKLGAGNFIIEASGSIDIGGRIATPQSGSGIVANDSTAKWGNVGMFGSLVFQIGKTGEYQTLISGQRINSGDQNVFIGINDSTYSDNTGHYIIRKGASQ